MRENCARYQQLEAKTSSPRRLVRAVTQQKPMPKLPYTLLKVIVAKRNRRFLRLFGAVVAVGEGESG
jgi:hypothetical protein